MKFEIASTCKPIEELETLDEIKEAIEHAVNSSLSERRNELIKCLHQAYRKGFTEEITEYIDSNGWDFLIESVYYTVDGDNLTLLNLKNYLNTNRLSLRYNKLNHCIDYLGFGRASKSMLSDTASIMIADDLGHYLKKVNENAVIRLCKAIATDPENSYNPVLDLINNAEWDGIDRREQLCNILKLSEEDTLSRVLIKKWLYQGYCLLHNDLDSGKPFGAEFILVFKGKQGSKKTRLLEKMAIRSEFFKEGGAFNPDSKDNLIESTKYFVCEFGEIGRTVKHVDALKAFITSTTDEYRAPFDKGAVKYPRMTNFCASTNETEYLKDQTGNRRFGTIPLSDDLKIDYDTQVKPFDSLQLWAQIAAEVEAIIATNSGTTYANVFRLTDDEREELEARNKHFTNQLPAEQEILDIITENTTPESGCNLDTEWSTATRLIERYSVLSKYKAHHINAVIKKLGIEVKARQRIDGQVNSNVFLFPVKRRIVHSNYAV